jgi:hypothetical protein
MLPDTTLCLLCLFFGKRARIVKVFRNGQRRKRLQTTNHEIELLQQDFDDALQEIDRL